MEIGRVGVVGAGTMGNGIAQAFAQSGFEVMLRDVGQPQIERGMASIRKSLDKFVEKGRISGAENEAALGRIETTVDLSALAKCDLVVEAIFENFEAKAAVFRELDSLLAPTAIL